MSDSSLISLTDATVTYGVTSQTLRRWVNEGKVRQSKPDGFHVQLSREDLNVAVPHVGRLLAEIENLSERLIIAEGYLPGN